MAERTNLFIAYCFPEKRWLDRVQAELEPVVGNAPCVIWDERKLANGVMWKTELPEVLASTKVAMMIVSDLFLESDFVTRARLPALLEMERKSGLEICWVLASHCLFELAGLKEADAGNRVAAALDGLGITQRDAEAAVIARKVAALLGVEPAAKVAPTPDAPPEPKQSRKKRREIAAEKIAPVPPAVSISAAAKPEIPPAPAAPATPSTPPPTALISTTTPAKPAPIEPAPASTPPPIPPVPSSPAKPAPAPSSVPPPVSPAASSPTKSPQDAPAATSPAPSILPATAPPTKPQPTAPAAPPPSVSPAASSPEKSPPTAPAAAFPAPPILPATTPPAKPQPTAPAVPPSSVPPAAASAAKPLPAATTPSGLEPAPAPAAITTLILSLETTIQIRQATVLKLSRLARWLLFGAAGIALAAIVVAVIEGFTHFLLVAGFAAVVAGLALRLHARSRSLGQGLVGMRYTRSGLADEALPSRQREALMRRADEYLAQN